MMRKFNVNNHKRNPPPTNMDNRKHGKAYAIRLNETELRKVNEWAKMRDLGPISVGKLLKRIILTVASNFEDDGFDLVLDKRNM